MCRQHFQAIKTTAATSEKETAIQAFFLGHDITSNVYNQEFGR
jgi:hypothetical protein